MGISTEQWRARIGTYNGGRGGRCRANQSWFSQHAAAWTTGEIMSTTPLTAQAGIAFVSLWMVLCAISYWWKKIESSHPTKLNRGSCYHWSKDTRTTVSITVCVSLVIAAAVLLHCLTLLLIMAGDVELNPGPGMDTVLTVADLCTMLEKLLKARTKWFNIGLKLKLENETLESIKVEKHAVTRECLKAVLTHRLQAGPPLTWRELCECLGSPLVLRNDVANTIREWIKNTSEQAGIGSSRKRPIIIDESPSSKRPKLGPDLEVSPSILYLHKLNWQPIKESFDEFHKSIKRSLEERNVSPKKVVETLSCFRDTYHLLLAEDTILFEVKQKLLESKSISDLWLIIEDFFTFYSYEILNHLVNSELATDMDRKKLNDYESKFDSYSYDILGKQFTSAHAFLRTEVIVKIRREYKKYSENHLEKFKKRLASVLCVDSDLLHLNYLEPGCIVLTYQAPFIAEIAVFPLTLEQEDALEKLGVIWLRCGKYHFSLKMSEVFEPNTEHRRVDLSHLLQGKSIKEEWCETYEYQNEDVLKVSFKVERVGRGEYMGLKFFLSTAYKYKRGARFNGVQFCILSKGKRSNNYLDHKFGEEQKWVLMYNEWKHLEFGNLGDYLHNMTSFELEWWLIESEKDDVYTRFYYN